MAHTALRSFAWLIKNGMHPPAGYLESLGDAEILAYSVAFGEFEGGEWDWNLERWAERK